MPTRTDLWERFHIIYDYRWFLIGHSLHSLLGDIAVEHIRKGEKPSRTIITGEGGAAPSRFKHVIMTGNLYCAGLQLTLAESSCPQYLQYIAFSSCPFFPQWGQMRLFLRLLPSSIIVADTIPKGTAIMV